MLGGWFGLHVGDLLKEETCSWVGLFLSVYCANGDWTAGMLSGYRDIVNLCGYLHGVHEINSNQNGDINANGTESLGVRENNRYK